MASFARALSVRSFASARSNLVPANFHRAVASTRLPNVFGVNMPKSAFSTATPVVKEEDKAELPEDFAPTFSENYRSTALLLGAAIAVNQEVYIINDETILAAGWIGLVYFLVKGAGGSVAEMLDERANQIAADLNISRENEKELLASSVTEAESDIVINQEVIDACTANAIKAWEETKMTKLVDRLEYECAAQTLQKLEAVHRIEETAKAKKTARIVHEVHNSVLKQIEEDPKFVKQSIDDAIKKISNMKV